MRERTDIPSGSPFEGSIGFSRAVRVGDRVLVSGTAPVWPDGSCPDDPTAQPRRCFEIIGDALAEAGTDLAAVIRTRMYLADPDAGDAVSALHGGCSGRLGQRPRWSSSPACSTRDGRPRSKPRR